jgi:mycothiol synthase
VIVRAPRPDELDAVLALMRAHDVAVWGGSDWTWEDLAEWWGELDLGRDAWVVELDGRLAGYADFEARPRGRLLADGYVDPPSRGRGVGSALADAVEARARAEPGGKLLHYSALHGSPDFFRRRGYREVRHVWRMVIDLDAPPEAVVPDGIEIRMYRPGEERAIHAAVEEAWSEGGWMHTPRPFEDFERRTFGREEHDPALYLIAADGDEIAGVALCDWKRNGEWGWLETLGVRPAWRRRGIAEALLWSAFRAFFERGEHTVALQVDAESPTGATRLYDRAGMRVLYEVVVWERMLGDD